MLPAIATRPVEGPDSAVGDLLIASLAPLSTGAMWREITQATEMRDVETACSRPVEPQDRVARLCKLSNDGRSVTYLPGQSSGDRSSRNCGSVIACPRARECRKTL